MPRVAAQKTHRTVSNSLTRVVTRRERVVVHRRGKAVAALIPLEDLTLLEELEDQKDVEEYRAAKAEWEREGRKTTSLDDVVKELGIRAYPWPTRSSCQAGQNVTLLPSPLIYKLASLKPYESWN